MDSQNRKYVVITPVRDEAEYLSATIECMLRQTILPREWVIVNDGSKDATGEIIEQYAGRYPWIRGIHRKDRGFRAAGGGVVDAFNEGYRALGSKDFDYIAKFDGDLSFPPDYFASCLAEFEADAKLGVGGGTICHQTQGEPQAEVCPKFHVRGATKIYRRPCWDQIGGFWAAPGWDTMDEIKANSLGWTSRSFPHLRLLHHRPTGTADGTWRTLVKYGRANYLCGYHPLFMLSKCLARLVQRPYIIGSAGLLYGFVSGYISRTPRIDEPVAIEFLRRQQINRLLRRETIWR